MGKRSGKKPLAFLSRKLRPSNKRSDSSPPLIPISGRPSPINTSVEAATTTTAVSGAGAKNTKKKTGLRLWMRFDRTGQSEILECDKNVIIRRAGIPARDLRILGPVFSQTSNILEAYPVLDELAKNVSTKNLERVRSLKSILTRLFARIQKVRDEIEHLLDDNEDILHLYLTRKQIQNQQLDALMAIGASNVVPSGTSMGRLNSIRYQRSASMATSIYSDNNDVEDLEMLLEAYFMQLDGIRNRILSEKIASIEQHLISFLYKRLENAAPVDYKEISDVAKANKSLIEEGSREEFYTEEHEKLLGSCESPWTLFVDGYNKDGMRIYDPVKGKTCHQCRQKTMGYRTNSCKCQALHGQFCGDCLYMRYGENVLEAMKNPQWICPVCRGICNCSFCRQKKGWNPTGTLYRKIVNLGYKSVAHFLIQTRRKPANSGENGEQPKLENIPEKRDDSKIVVSFGSATDDGESTGKRRRGKRQAEERNSGNVSLVMQSRSEFSPPRGQEDGFV